MKPHAVCPRSRQEETRDRIPSVSVGTESPSSEAVPKGKHRTRKGRGCNRCEYMCGSNPSDCTRAVKSTSGLRPNARHQAKRRREVGGQAGRWGQNRRGQQARRRASSRSGRAAQRPRRRRQSRANRAGTRRAGRQARNRPQARNIPSISLSGTRRIFTKAPSARGPPGQAREKLGALFQQSLPC